MTKPTFNVYSYLNFTNFMVLATGKALCETQRSVLKVLIEFLNLASLIWHNILEIHSCYISVLFPFTDKFIVQVHHSLFTHFIVKVYLCFE